MKNQIYDVTVAFTSDELVCCKCNCKAGCEGNEKGVCVHVLPLILLFMLFLMNDFGQHILVQFCHWWDMALVDLKSKISSKEMKILTSSILILMNACGVDTNVILVEKKRYISDLLTIFRVGTQNEAF
jgi:hypothetical protein